MIGVAILGCTGSIGKQTLDVVRQYKDEFRVCALVCGTDAVTLIKQAEEFRPEFVGIADETKREALCEIGYKCEIFAGENAQEIAASLSSVDIVVASVVGLSGLKGVITAINAGKRVALANKETLVACGKYVTELAAKKHVEILPVDSEHSAIFPRCKIARRTEKRYARASRQTPELVDGQENFRRQRDYDEQRA